MRGIRRRARPAEIQSARRLDATTTSGPTSRAHDVPYNALHDRGYPSHRLRAVHARRRARRGRPRRPLVVGEPRAQGMRPARRPGRQRRAQNGMSASRMLDGIAMHAGAAERASPDRAPPTSTTSTGSSPRPSTSCARWRAVRATRRCSSPAARIRSCCCASPRRRSGPGRFPFPLLHIDTGHNFPRSDRVPRPRARPSSASA